MGLFGMFGSRESGSDPREAEARKMQAETIVRNILENVDVPEDKLEAIKQKMEMVVKSQLSLGLDEKTAASQARSVLTKETRSGAGASVESEEAGSDNLREALKGLVADASDEGAMKEFVIAFAQSEGLGAAETSEMMKAVKSFVEQYPQFLPQDAEDDAQLDRFIGAVKKQVQIRRGDMRDAA